MKITASLLLLPLLVLGGCAATAPTLGDASAKTAATGSAGGANAQNANRQLERCDKTLGTITIVEEANQPWLYQFTQEYHMQSTVPMLRMIIPFMDSYNQLVKAVSSYQAQSVQGGLGNGGTLKTN